MRRSIRDWLVLVVLSASGGVVFLLPFLQEIYYSSLREVLALDNTQVGSLLAVFGATSLLSYFPGGWLADKLPPRLLLSASLLLTGASGLYFATFPPYWIALAIHAFWGFSVTLLFWGAMIRVTRGWGGVTEQGRAFGLLESGRGLTEVLASSALLAAFAALGASEPALRTVIIALSAIIMAFGLLAAIVIRESAPPDAPAGEAPGFWRVRLVLRLPATWYIAGIIFCSYCAYHGTFRFTPFATDMFGLSVTFAAAIAVGKGWGKPIAAAIAGVIADRVGISRSVSTLLALLALSYLAIALLPGGSLWVLPMLLNLAVIALAVFGLRGIYFALLEESRIPEAVTGTATGVISVIAYTPDIFMPLLGGWLTDRFPGSEGYRYFFLMVAALCALGFFTSIALSQLNRRLEL